MYSNVFKFVLIVLKFVFKFVFKCFKLFEIV